MSLPLLGRLALGGSILLIGLQPRSESALHVRRLNAERYDPLSTENYSHSH